MKLKFSFNNFFHALAAVIRPSVTLLQIRFLVKSTEQKYQKHNVDELNVEELRSIAPRHDRNADVDENDDKLHNLNSGEDRLHEIRVPFQALERAEEIVTVHEDVHACVDKNDHGLHRICKS